MTKLKSKIKTGLTDLTLFWKKPPKGKYMTFKEIASLSVGGIGVKLVVTCTQAMILSTSNFLIANVIGLDQKTIYFLYVISVISSFPLTALRASIIDNTRSKKGKYRPYLIYMGLPTVILSLIFVWAPYERMEMFWKCAVILICNIGFQFFYNFYSDAYGNYIVVLSPNTQERANVSSIKAVTDSFAPSIINIFLPIGAKLITGENTLDKLIIYRYLYTPLLIVGFLIGMLAYVNTTEKIVQAKTHIIQVKFMDALRAVAKNKYFWIISFAGWLGFLENSYTVILQWLYNYQKVCSDGTYSLITAIYGNASFWGMLFAPALIKRFGKKKLLVVTNLTNVVFIACMYPIIKYADAKAVIWLILGCLFMNGAVCAVAHIIEPCINGDIRDYQQYITGERIDGMYAAVGLIGTVIMLLTSGILPFLYEKGGINAAKAAELGINLADPNQNVYHVLYNTEVFHSVVGIIIGASVVGAILNVIPYFFYDLTETKQQGIVKVLKVRAAFEDYGNNVLTNNDLVSVIDLIHESQEYAAMKTAVPDKKAGGKKYRETKELNTMILSSRMVMDELERFNSDFGKYQLAMAQKIYTSGLNALVLTDKSLLDNARIMPTKTEEQKQYRKYAVEKAKQLISAKKIILKNYPDGIKEYDESIFSGLFVRENEIISELEKAYADLKDANENKDKARAAEANERIKAIRVNRRALDKEIKTATDENSVYHRASKPYIDAKTLIAQAENYKKFDEIAGKYDEAKAASELAEQLAAEEEQKLAIEKKEYTEKLLAEKKAAKQAKKVK